MPIRALVNGIASDCLPVGDRGLMYGDGLFETIAVRRGCPCLWAEHYERLAAGAARLGIPCPGRSTLYRECLEVADGCERCVVKLILTRGEGGRGYAPPRVPQPSRLLLRYPWPEHPAEWARSGVRARLCALRLGENPALAGVKHLNRLEQVLARSEWQDPEIAEGVLCDGRGRVIGGTMTNLFLVRGERLLTSRIDTCGIRGTVRGLVLRRAEAFGLKPIETDLGIGDLWAAEAILLTNALIGVWPVLSLESHRFQPERLPAGLIAEVRLAALHPSGGEAI